MLGAGGIARVLPKLKLAASDGTDLRYLAGAEHPSEPLGPLNRWNLNELDIVISHKHSPPLFTLLISVPSRPYTPFALFSLIIVLFVRAPRVESWEGNRYRSNLLPAVTEVANPPWEFIHQFRCTQQPALDGSATQATQLRNASTWTRNTRCCISLCRHRSISTLVLQLFWHNKRRTLARDAYFCCSDLLSPFALLRRITYNNCRESSELV